MAKTKWIVPAIAMVLCAASLIGAGYAAYTATLTDTETVTVDQNFVTLNMGARDVAWEVNLFYDSTASYVNGAQAASNHHVYVPYIDKNTTTGLQTVKIGSFVINVDSADKGNEVNITQVDSKDSYTLALSVPSWKDGGVACDGLTGATIGVYTNEVCTSAATLSSMESGTTYYIGITYNQNGSTDVVTDAEPSASLTLGFTMTVTANIVDPAP